MAKFRQLQARAMGAVRGKVQAVLKHATQQVQAAVQEASAPSATTTGGGKPSPSVVAQGAVPVLAEGAEVSLLYVRFRAAAEPGLKGEEWCDSTHIVHTYLVDTPVILCSTFVPNVSHSGLFKEIEARC